MAPIKVEFVDSRLGKCSALVHESAGVVAIQWARGKEPTLETNLPSPEAVLLARAILAAAGERSASPLPQSRQIGGIIGPY
jgi:hypothetical protein